MSKMYDILLVSKSLIRDEMQEAIAHISPRGKKNTITSTTTLAEATSALANRNFKRLRGGGRPFDFLIIEETEDDAMTDILQFIDSFKDQHDKAIVVLLTDKTFNFEEVEAMPSNIDICEAPKYLIATFQRIIEREQKNTLASLLGVYQPA